MVLNFDGLAGCLGTVKALQIGGMPGSGCTQAFAYRLCDFCLAIPTDGANCNRLSSEDQRIVVAFTS